MNIQTYRLMECLSSARQLMRLDPWMTATLPGTSTKLPPRFSPSDCPALAGALGRGMEEGGLGRSSSAGLGLRVAEGLAPRMAAMGARVALSWLAAAHSARALQGPEHHGSVNRRTPMADRVGGCTLEWCLFINACVRLTVTGWRAPPCPPAMPPRLCQPARQPEEALALTSALSHPRLLLNCTFLPRCLV